MILLDGVIAAIVVTSGAFWLFTAFQAVRMGRQMRRLGLRLTDVAPELPTGRSWPKISVIVPACNEEEMIEASIRSLLAQDYPALEVVAIDDRSSDGTGRILDALAGEDARLAVIHIKELPDGWLGKNHANHQGSQSASGDWLLFTDGDVKFSPDALRRAIAFALRFDLGHAVALPRFATRGFLECSFVATFCFFFSLKIRLWDLMRPGTRAFIGSGTFNLVRRDEYARIGGHRTLRMEVADDMKLGLVLRRSGVRQGAVDSCGMVSVRWQDGFAASVRGLFKNAFSGSDWRWSTTVMSTLGIALISVLPALVLVFAPSGVFRLLAAVPVVLAMSLHGLTARQVAGGTGLEGVIHPAMALVLTGVLLWSALAATLRGGIVWRGTHYPLARLKAGCIRESSYPLTSVVGWDERKRTA